MKTRLTLATVIATSLACGSAFAQTYSPNPNKAQNSDLRTQSGAYGSYEYPSGSYLYLDRNTYVVPGAAYVYPGDSPSTVWIVPSPVVSEPTAGTRNVYVPAPERSSTTYTPNPNKVQNNGVPTQYDTYYIYRSDIIIP